MCRCSIVQAVMSVLPYTLAPELPLSAHRVAHVREGGTCPGQPGRSIAHNEPASNVGTELHSNPHRLCQRRQQQHDHRLKGGRENYTLTMTRLTRETALALMPSRAITPSMWTMIIATTPITMVAPHRFRPRRAKVTRNTAPSQTER